MKKQRFKKYTGTGAVLVAHAYNFSYLGGRDGEDHDLRPNWVKSKRDLMWVKEAGHGDACLQS
jgi:hypothetical protein